MKSSCMYYFYSLQSTLLFYLHDFPKNQKATRKTASQYGKHLSREISFTSILSSGKIFRCQNYHLRTLGGTEKQHFCSVLVTIQSGLDTCRNRGKALSGALTASRVLSVPPRYLRIQACESWKGSWHRSCRESPKSP